MRIAVLGGTGTIGKHVVAVLRARSHEVRVLSRRSPEFPVDVTTGEGLAAALDGCNAVVDASNAGPRHAAPVLVEGSRRLLVAEQQAGVAHHICISIVGCERVPASYYRVKVEQERVAEQGGVPCTIVRATQFHELALAALNAVGKYHVLPVPAMQLQTVAAVEAAQAVADVAAGPPGRGRVQVAGPEVSSARDLAKTWQSVSGRRAVLVPVPVPGKLGRTLRSGGLTADDADVLGQITFADWLAGTLA